MMPNAIRRRTRAGRLAALALLAVTLATPVARAQSTLPTRYADSTFWRLMTEFSEPDGFFQSDNLVSNETSFQWVVPTLRSMTRPDGVYLGVAPEQNFTFIAALKPKVAFILDIRRGNLVVHLMYKALFETSPNRVDFAFRLFGRKRPDELATSVGVEELFAAIASMPADTAYARAVRQEIKDRLVKGHGFALSQQDLEWIDYVHGTFAGAGPGVRYNMGRGGYGGFGRMPNYSDLMTESDSLGTHRSYLATDESYATLRDMQERNVIVPFTGDFAGTKALKAFGDYVRANKGVVQAIYVSNVEQYLFRSADNWRRYYDNVATLPIDSTSVFIRSATQGWNRVQSPRSRQNELLCPVQVLLDAYKAGRIFGYGQVFELCR
jgi:hypothetical protein